MFSVDIFITVRWNQSIDYFGPYLSFYPPRRGSPFVVVGLGLRFRHLEQVHCYLCGQRCARVMEIDVRSDIIPANCVSPCFFIT